MYTSRLKPISNSQICPWNSELSTIMKSRESWNKKKKIKNKLGRGMNSTNSPMRSSLLFLDGTERKRERTLRRMTTMRHNREKTWISFLNGIREERFWHLISKTSTSKAQRFRQFLYLVGKRLKIQSSMQRKRKVQATSRWLSCPKPLRSPRKSSNTTLNCWNQRSTIAESIF